MEGFLNTALAFVANYFSELGHRLISLEFALTLECVLIFLAYDIQRKGWRGHWLRNHFDNVVTTLLLSALSLIFVPLYLVAIDFLEHAYFTLSIPTVPASFWNGWPLPVQVLLLLLALDLIDYWNHRVMHTRWVWPIHAIHHSDSDVNGFTSMRIHLLEALFMNATHIFFLSWLGLSHLATGAVVLFLLVLNVYVHLNVDWNHGRFHLLLASPRFHRWHHADEPTAYGKNLANIFPFYDWIFGTHYNPGPCEAVMGVKDVPDKSAFKLLIFPFVAWIKEIRSLS
jgi:sterol desaturase/sphingolipid hydroxylase (fatty acid hydroxylase superfamily)